MIASRRRRRMIYRADFEDLEVKDLRPRVNRRLEATFTERTIMSENHTPDWTIYKGASKPTAGEVSFPTAPPWRDFAVSVSRRGETYQATPEQIRIVNAALYLRRPLLVTGRP